MRALPATIVLTLGISAASLLGGCGSSTKTVSVAGAPTAPQTGTGPSPSAAGPGSGAHAGTTAQTATAGGTRPPTTTRRAPEPAFVQQATAPNAADGLSGATAVVRSRGFTPSDTAGYHPNQTLRVLLGTRRGTGNRYVQQAFFFVSGRYLGTDSSVPSAMLRILGQSDTDVTLAYPLYGGNDRACCPSGGQASVRFQLDNGRLRPLDPIPSASARTAVSRP